MRETPVMVTPWFHAAAALVALCAGCEEASEVAEDHAALLSQHCQPDNRASAYTASTEGATGRAAELDGAGLNSCYQLTGHGSAENTLAIDADGTVYVAPVMTPEGTGLLRSSDLGERWEVLLPGERGGYDHGKVQPYLFMDPTTERLFFTNPAEGGFVMSYSDDGGDSFAKTTLMPGTIDWLKVAIGPSPDGSLDNAMYAIAPAPTSTPTPLPDADQPEFQRVERSLDGGESWERVGGDALSLVPADHGCPDSEWVIYGGGVVTPDGVVYFGLRRCKRLALAFSRDQGETWAVRDVPGSELPAYAGIFSHIDLPNLLIPEPLAADPDGNLFALWVDAGGALRMSVSRDSAETWSKPVAVADPDAPFTVYPAASFDAQGHMALAYYGSPDGVSYHAYLAESDNPLDPEPRFVGARLNAVDAPLHAAGFDVGYATVVFGGDLVEIVQVRHAPNGDLWAAFAADMCPGIMANDPCVDWIPADHGDTRFQGAIGRLVHDGE